MSNLATPMPGRNEEDWAELDLAPTAMRGRVDLKETAQIVLKIRSDRKLTGQKCSSNLRLRRCCSDTRRSRSSCGMSADHSKTPVETNADDEQGPSGSGRSKAGEDEDQEDRQAEKSMEQDPNLL